MEPQLGHVNAGVRAVIVLVLALFAYAPWDVPPASGQPAAPATGQKGSAQPMITAIPVPEIAQRAEQVAVVLRSAEQGPAGPDAEDIEPQLPAADEWIRGHLSSTARALRSSPSANALANLTDSWQLMRGRLAAWNDTLTARATLLEQRVKQLETMRMTWSATRKEALDSLAPPSALERVDETTAAIVVARRSADERLARVLGLQDRVVKELARCDEALTRIVQASHALDGPLLVRDSMPIWTREARTQVSANLSQQLHDSVADIVELMGEFLASQRGRVPLQIALFVLVVVLARQAHAAARRRADKEPSEIAVAQVFELPISSGLLLALLATAWIYSHQPRVLMHIVGLLVLLPAVLLVRRLASAPVVPAVYALAAFFLIDRVRDVCSVAPVLEQWVFLLEMASGIVFLALVARSEHLATDPADKAPFGWRRVIAWILWAQLSVLVGAVFAGALGYMRLARLLGGAVLASNYVALLLYVGARIGDGLVAYVLRARPSRRLFMVQQHRALLQRRITQTLRWFCVGVWAYFTLGALGVMDPIWSAGEAALDARYGRGSISLSLGDVVALVLTVSVAFALSAFVRFVLQEDVYPRVGLPRGVPYAASALVHYAIVVAGFVVAVAALGVDLTRITILAGALGVGVGIGLQSVVANFVSGLILLLERRIHVGDSVQIGDLQGQVREIGSRASTIRTGDGAEVIIPNGSLTSERVTNWTLSDRMRRVNLDVRVSYASDPQRVLEILRNVGRAHPKAMTDPAPIALCTGYGDSALTFVLRVWAAHAEEAESIFSQLAVTVHGALTAAKIEIPLPQRDVHIRSVDHDSTVVR